MKIQRCQIKNFRGLSDIDLVFENKTCLVAGPNAIGKSTVLEAIRLNRAVLLPRYPTEGQSVLHALGAVQNPNQIMLRGGYFDFSAIARDANTPLNINLDVILNDDELRKINASLDQLAYDHLRGSLGNQGQQDQLALTQYLSSPEGRARYKEGQREMQDYAGTLNTTDPLSLKMIIFPNGQARGDDAKAQLVAGFLERSLSPSEALFSIFTADRALPTGEAAIQLGAGDADNQIKSHIAEPNLKYQRLKHGIANATLLKQEVEKDFQIIFDEILPGKKLAGLSISPIGNFRVAIQEEGLARPFDIDSLSSGEKGLILTFLIIRRTIAKGGIVLIDEPELHLNPGVCRKLLNFLIDHCIKTNDVQAVICTHSAEILNTAYERSDCDIHHLKAHDNATPIFRGDFDEMFQALGRLGVSPAESFFYEGNVFVEGPVDEEILVEGFRSTLGDRIKVTSLGGRKAVEAEIRNLQASEKTRKLDKMHCFLFDQDRDTTALCSTPLVKVVQWDRYCLENYLLNLQILYDVFNGTPNVDLPDRGIFANKVKELAKRQIRPIVARQIYEPDRPRSPGLANEDLSDDYADMAEILAKKLTSLRSSVSKLDIDAWKVNFLKAVDNKHTEVDEQWDTGWAELCDGKKLLEVVCREYSVNRDRTEIKKDIVRRLRDQQTVEWQNVDKKLREAITR
ncbi:MAG: AAA family ATPase [Gammaproteobacteria bacterium]|nr:AAA family ATPase [Gammaproteobacteria bacterium]